MPVLKMFIDGKLVDSVEISFAGLEAEEKPAHVEGLTQWMKRTNYVPEGSSYEIFLDGVKSKVHDIIKSEKLPVPSRLRTKHRKTVNRKENQPEVVFEPAVIEKPKKRIFELPLEPDEKKEFTRPKAEYTNKQWWEE